MTTESQTMIDYTRLNAMKFGDVVFSQRSIRRIQAGPHLDRRPPRHHGSSRAGAQRR